MAPELDQLLGRSDYGEYWLKEAKHHAQRRGWRADRLEQTLSILESTFGADWLQQEARRPERAALSGETAKHPVAHMLAVPSATSVASAIELAVYLQRCAAVPRYSDVVSCLKASPQLDGTVIQLAFGYRFQRLGCTGLEFEPPVDDGRRSDLVFEHGGVSYLVECYRPKELTNQNFKELVNESLPRISAAAQEAGRRVVARIVVPSEDACDAACRKAILRESADLVRKLTNRQRLAVRTGEYEIEVFDTAGVDSKEVETMAWSMTSGGDWVLNQKLVPARQVPGIGRGMATDGLRMSWVIISERNRPDPFDEIAGLARSIERKIPQVRRREQSARGIILVNSWIARAAAFGRAEFRPTLERIQARILAKHRGLSGVFLVDRGWDRECRPFVGGAFVSGPEGVDLTELFARLAKQEGKRDVILDWD